MSADARPRRRGSLAIRVGGLVAVIGFIGLLVFGVVAQAPDTTIDDAIARSEPAMAPGFTLDVLTPGTVRGDLGARATLAIAEGRLALEELRGTPVVLNLWASWCDPCRTEAPVLERGSRRAARRGVLFVGLNMQDAPGDAREFLREFRVTYPNVREGDNRTARRYGATGLPETFFIDAGGRAVAHVIGAITADQLRDGIAAARSGNPTVLGAGGASRPAR